MDKFDVVVSGMSGRFPEADDIDTFKNKLFNLENFITTNNKKWPIGYQFNLGEHVIPDGTGKYTNVEYFDYRAFKFNQVFAESYDIVNRKVMEPSYEAVVDAGINPHSLEGENIGVYMSTGIVDFESKIGTNNAAFPKLLIGTERTMQANRISFAWNLVGPSLSYPSDVLGSFEALRSAYKAVSEGHVSSALVGVSSNIMDPKISLLFLRKGFLSSDGLSCPFDEQANGYGRSESTVVLYLQRAEDAKRSYGSILFCDTDYIGSHESTMIGFDEHVLRSSLETIYKRNNFLKSESQLSFLEMSAPGIKKFDTMESNVISDMLCKGRQQPLLVGSIKSNVGHTEGAAPFMSLLKVLFALDSGLIAPNANFKVLNKKIFAFKNQKMKVVDCLTELEGDLVGVNAWGFSGMVSHAVVKRHLKTAESEVTDNLPRLILICGRTEKGLRKAIEQIEKLPINPNFVSLMNDAFGTNMPIHVHRGYTILSKSFEPVHSIEEKGDHGRPVWFVFSGMGSQWNGCGKGLLELPAFNDVIKRCDAVLKPFGVDIYHILTSDDPVFDNILHSFVAITSIQVGLFEVLKSIGVKADGIIGHSLGENACGYADGCLTLEQVVLAAYERGYVSVNTKSIRGMMAAVGKGYHEIKNSLPKDVYVACHNARDNCTLSGPAEVINDFVENLKREGVFAKSVNVANFAYHSPHISDLGPLFRTRLSEVIPLPKERSSKWISTSVPECDWNKPVAKYCSAEYFTNNMLGEVLFEEGSKHIPENAIVIELAPHGLLQAILKRSLPKACTNIPLTRRSETKENLKYFLSAIGRMYISGCELQVNNLFPKVSFPVPRGTPSLAPYCTWFHEELDPTNWIYQPSPEKPLSQEKIIITLNHGSAFSYLRHHKIGDQVVIPPSLFVYLTCWMYSLKQKEKLGLRPLVLEDIRIEKIVKLSMSKPREISIMVQTCGYFEVLLDNEGNPEKSRIVASGLIGTSSVDPLKSIEDVSIFQSRFSVNKNNFYTSFQKVGYKMDDDFALVERVVKNINDNYGKIRWNANWVTYLDAAMKFQLFSKIQENTKLMYPTFIRKLTLNFAQFGHIEKGSLQLCYHDFVANRFQSLGLEIRGMECKMVPSPKESSLKLEPLQFVSHQDPKCQSADEFVFLCLQIAVENLLATSKIENPKLYVSASREAKTYLKNIEGVLEKGTNLKIHVQFSQKSEVPLEEINFFLITTDLQDAFRNQATNMFVLLITSSLNLTNGLKKNFSFVTKQIFQKEFIFMQKKIIGEQNGFLNDDELNKNLRLTVKHNVDLNQIVSIKKSSNNGKYLFVLDDCDKEQKNNIPVAQWSSFLYSRHNVLKNGILGSYKRVLSGKNKIAKACRNINLSTTQLQAICIDDCRDILLEHSCVEKNKHFVIEYSGSDEFGKSVMGIASVKLSTKNGQIDPFLEWNLPSEWSFEEAVTVPNLYSLAYHIYTVSNNRGLSTSVLINVGPEILFARICVRLFLQKKYFVYVNVPTDYSSSPLFQNFPEMDEVNVLIENECKYERQLLHLTKGKGVEVIVNCLPGREHINASFNCAGCFSTVFDIHTNNNNIVTDIGLHPFLKSVSYRFVPSGISFISNLSLSDKKKLHEMVQHGIDSGFVIPLPKIVSSIDVSTQTRCKDYKNVIKCSSNDEEFNKSQQFDSQHSYLLIGNSSDNSWRQLLSWLKIQGCHRFFVAIEDVSGQKELLDSLTNHDKVSVSYVSRKEFDSIERTQAIVNQMQNVSPLGAIFFVSLASANEIIRNVDTALRSSNLRVPLISLFSGGLQEMESRRAAGLPACVLHSENAGNDFDMAAVMDELTRSYNIRGTCPALFNVSEDSYEIGNQNTSLKLRDFLPAHLLELESFGKTIQYQITFREHTSLSPPYAQTKGVYPIFVLPAAHGDRLERLIRKLYYPVFCASFTRFEFSLPEVANRLFEELCTIQPSGPISLVSESWNVCLALEMSLLFKSAQREHRIFLLEGNPDEWSRYVRSFGAPFSSDFDNILLKELFDLDLPNEFGSMPDESFREKVRYCLERINCKNLNVEYMCRAASTIKYHLSLTTQFNVTEEILENVTLLVRNFSNNHNTNLSVTSNVVIINDVNYEHFLRNPRLRSAINENVIFKW